MKVNIVFLHYPVNDLKTVIPMLARQSATARRRENGNPDAVPAKAGIHYKRTWVPLCTGNPGFPRIEYGASLSSPE